MKTVKKTRRNVLGSARKRRVGAFRANLSPQNGTHRRRPSRLRSSAKPRHHGGVRANHKRAGRAEIETQRSDPRYQSAIKNFEIAARAFQRQNYEKAKEVFEKLASCEVFEVAERARVHLRLCEQRLGRPAQGPKTSEGLYTLGVGELNARQLNAAVEHLTKAQRLDGKQDHIRYALAAAHALRGNPEEALEHLKAAIELRPENRIHARHDDDFRGLAQDPRFRNLVSHQAASDPRVTPPNPA